MNNLLKKNDFATFLAYIAMFAVALLVGLLVISPTIRASSLSTPESVVIVVVSVIVGVIFNSAGLELLHMLGAFSGGYQILSVCILSLTFRKRKNRKEKIFTFASFEGLTGETKVNPKDPEKSNPTGMILFPMLGYLIEVIVLLILAAVFHSVTWVPVGAYVVLAIGGMIFIYNAVPAHLDSLTDGYLLVLLSKPVNRLAYNQILLAEHSENKEKALAELPVYGDISDFTANLNTLAAYRKAKEGKLDEALSIFSAIASAEKGVSKSVIQEASCQKLALLLLLEKNGEAKDYYEGMSDADRRYIAALSSLPALRCYALVSGVFEESDSEVSWAFDKVERLQKKVSGVALEGENVLLTASYSLLKKMHPEWDIQADFIEHQGKETK